MGRALDVLPAVRIGVATAIGIVVGLVLTWSSREAALLGGWAAAGLVYVLWTLLVIVPMDGDATNAHALREVPTRVMAHAIVLLASLASLGGVAAVLVGGQTKHKPVVMAAVLTSVVASWAATHVTFALRYARMYYAAPVGGIDFHQKEPPRYTDFTYLSVTIGMSFAVSDTDVAASRFRRTAQVHALLSYLFGTVIVALLVNLVAGLSG